MAINESPINMHMALFPSLTCLINLLVPSSGKLLQKCNKLLDTSKGNWSENEWRIFSRGKKVALIWRNKTHNNYDNKANNKK